MGLKIVDLLRWRESFVLKDEDDKDIIVDGKPVKIYMRVVGDQDLQDSYKAARILSADKRRALRDETSLEFKDQVLPIREASREECVELIKVARSQNLQSEAYANTVRPDDVKLDEIAIDPDAPTLEEQERLDAANEKNVKDFEAALTEYVTTKTAELEQELAVLSIEDLRVIAEAEVSNITSLSLFLQEVLDHKIVAACYTNSALTDKAFDSVAEYRQSAPIIKKQISEAYMKLEAGTEEIKN